MCVQRRNKGGRLVNRGGSKSEKCPGKKERGGRDTLSRDRMGEKDMEEVIGGSHLRALVVCRHRNRNGIDQLTLKMVSVNKVSAVRLS